MSLFTVDSNNVFSGGIAEAGKYNVQIVKTMNKVSGRNNQYVTIDYEVLDGKYKGSQIKFQNVTWDNDDVENSTKRFNTIAVAIGAKDGAVIESVAQFANAIKGKKLSIDIDWEKPNSKGKVYLGVKGYGPLDPDGSKPNGVTRPTGNSASSKAKTSNATSTAKNDPFANNGEQITIDDDSLPF
ncbi:DUF669 domain-containing protein [Pediococcus ethanolidurans]|uniref:DUF669 domain-containing protein n=1 Tax=Pediococcus ethanolidurans TaxID=319653 RepID=UPI0021E74873|nr:DUF669 domain-containing protein [Pediococcus ethanolidurans]MCV3327617.1 DUF669 domain-containing protein [Pediococcus ethanolidurans]